MPSLQDRVHDIVDERIRANSERGVQVSVRRHGEVLVDLALGSADPAGGRPLTPDTPVFSWSVAKGITATAVHVLVQQGRLDHDTAVADIWPEFAAHGKGGITVRHVLTHTAGVPAVPMDTTVENLADWDHMCAAIADETPWWEPGTRTGYHAYTYGFILGEVVRRASGRRISAVVRDEVAAPLGVDGELFLAVPRAELPRLARLEDAPGPPMNPDDFPPDLPMFRTGPKSFVPCAELGNRADVLTAEIPAVGTVTARAMTSLYDALLAGRILDHDRFLAAVKPAFSGTDAIFGNRATWALGYALGLPAEPEPVTRSVFGMGGAGGSHAWADTATGVSFAVTRTRFDLMSDLGGEIIDLVRAETTA